MAAAALTVTMMGDDGSTDMNYFAHYFLTAECPSKPHCGCYSIKAKFKGLLFKNSFSFCFYVNVCSC